MTNRVQDKAHRYIAALDNARCQDKWDEVPELIRKVTKHAPHETCLIETATAELQVVAHVKKKPLALKATNSTSPTPSNLWELIPSLLSTVDKAGNSEQAALQAQVCLGWVHWTLNEPGLAATRLPKDFAATVDSLSTSKESLSPWTEVCLVKGCYIKGTAQSITSNVAEALETFESAIPWLNSRLPASLANPQFLHWSDKLLSRGAIVAGNEVCAKAPRVDDNLVELALKLFRLWSAHPNVGQGAVPLATEIEGPAEPASAATTWKSYYNLLSTILQQGLVYIAPENGPKRPQLAREFRHVESMSEASLLREEKFPMANAHNPHVEIWVEQVIRNWEILCGPQWTDEDLGDGGQNAMGRNVLDILYRAASKTYHSHNILRRLFHVHSSLANFDLAMKALDSYIEIVTGAKDRAEKSAEYGELESDEIFLQTLSEGVFTLCCFGSFEEAEKAKGLTEQLKKYVSKHVRQDENSLESKKLELLGTGSSSSQKVSPSILAMTFRAIGVGLANWASWTPINETRNDVRMEAIGYLENSISPELENEFNYSSLYALAMLLAENRDLDGAIDYVKSALAWNSQSAINTVQADLSRQRDLVALWHLLALLLSAKKEFGIAERACEAAFEQFPSALTSFGLNEKPSPEQLQDPNERYNITGLKNTLIEQLQGREKERIIETRMTQLAFFELLEGPEAALNHSDHLLGLFAVLFPDLDQGTKPEKKAKEDQDQELLVPPKSSSGTRSLRGSVFGRHHKSHRAPGRRARSMSSIRDRMSPSPARSHKEQSPEPTVTADHTVDATASTDLGRSDSTRHKLRKRGSLKRLGSRRSQNTHHINGNGTNGFEAPESQQEPSGEEVPSGQVAEPAVSNAHPTAQLESAKQPLPPIAHNLKHSQQPAPIGHTKQPPEQDVRLPVSYRYDSPTTAVTRFPTTEAQKYALGILVKIWLFVAGLYRRASLFEDAEEACEEASRQAAKVEALVASHESSARSFSARGWGGGKSSEELWGDVDAEKGFLAQTRSRPHEAIELFEEALVRDPDHPKATIGLANLLLDIWDQKLPAELPQPSLEYDLPPFYLSDPAKLDHHSKSHPASSAEKPASTNGWQQKGSDKPSVPKDDEPKLLSRLAARDRAYGLLSALTKRGSSWDNSEAWYALSRAYEAGGQIEKLKEVLWWCIELEDRRPIRHWSNIGSGLYVL